MKDGVLMKKLGELTARFGDLLLSDISGAELDKDISSIVYDTRTRIEKDAAFVCIKGASFDGHGFAGEAVKSGAGVLFVEDDIKLDDISGGDTGNVTVIKVRDTRKALSLLSAAWFDHPADKLTTIALTGTKGKSTTCYMIKSILEGAGRKCGIIGTIGIVIGEKVYETHNTTPESFLVQEYMKMMVDAGCDTLIMEVSSQGLKQSRVYGVIFDIAVFTNLSKDHIGGAEHKDFEEYVYCKSLLFKQCKKAVVNTDDPHFTDMIKDSTAEIEGFCIDGAASADITKKITVIEKASDLTLTKKGGIMGIEFDYDGHFPGKAALSIPGRFNVMNALCAITVCSHFTDDTKVISDALYSVHVRGRLEPVKISDRFTLLIDYAHNAVALENVLGTLREYEPGRLVCLFGCGGNRSKDRRYEMGEISSKMADLTVVTSDNPRYEKPEDIINDILIGVNRGTGKYITIPDRRDAIRYVIENAEDGDCILLAGKGNEDYQEIEGVRYHMDEREIIADIVGGV